MKFSEYISTHHVFTTHELVSACDSAASVTQQLWLATKSGKVEKVRRGVYASFYGRFDGSIPDPFVIVHGCDRDAVLCYHSALTALGVEHNVFFQCDFMSESVKSPFAYRGIRYMPHKMDLSVMTKKVRIHGDEHIACTSKEQTIIDCMDRPWLAGGAEEVIRALSLLSYIDEVVLGDLLERKQAPSLARIGWLLDSMRDSWHVDASTLEKLHSALGKGPYRFGRPQAGDSGWSAKWKLLLPDSNDEVSSWFST